MTGGRGRVEPTAEFAHRQLRFTDPTQRRYEVIRPLLLFEDRTATQRAQETATHPDTVRAFLRRFRQQGMLGLLPDHVEASPRGRASRVPEAVRQEIARLKALYRGFHYREVVRIIFYKYGYRLHPKTVKQLWQQDLPAVQGTDFSALCARPGCMRTPGEIPMKVRMTKGFLATRSHAATPCVSIRARAGTRCTSMPVMPGGTGRRHRCQNLFRFTYFHGPSAARPLG